MENISVLNSNGFINDKINEPDFNSKINSSGATCLTNYIVNLCARRVINIFRYLKSFGLSGDPDLMILSSTNHCFNKENGLKDVRTSANLKKLNHIKNLDAFLSDLVRNSPPGTSFIGYFSDRITQKGNGYPFYQPSGVLDRSINITDSVPNYEMDKNDISELLETYGFKIIDTKDISGLTFFNSEYIHRQVELRKAS